MKNMRLGVVLIGLLTIGMVCPVHAAIYSYSLDGGTTQTLVSPFESEQSAADYYDYYSSSGHPAFGTEEGVAFFWLWGETDTGALSLNVIFSTADSNTTGAGRINFSLTGLPPGWSWDLQDDNEDIGTLSDDTPTWYWDNQHTDGGIITGLEDSNWDITWTASTAPNRFQGINEWYFLSPDAAKKANSFSLSLGETLTVSAVPIPGAVWLLGSGLLGIFGIASRRTRLKQ